jgi:predicted nucleotidyltransferase
MSKLSTRIMEFLRDEFNTANQWEIYLIGSFVTYEQTPESDIDILVTDQPDAAESPHGRVYKDAIEVNNTTHDLHININTTDGVNVNKPHEKLYPTKR